MNLTGLFNLAGRARLVESAMGTWRGFVAS